MSSDRFARFGFIEYNITNYMALSAMNELFAKYNPTFRFVDIAYMPTLPIYAVVYRIFKSSTAYRF
jgi:hypothetical protein